MTKKLNDRLVREEEYFVYTVMLAEAVVKLCEAWDAFREFQEEPNRELTEREVIHLRSALLMTKEVYESISCIAQEYNSKNAKDKKVVKFKTGALTNRDDKETDSI